MQRSRGSRRDHIRSRGAGTTLIPAGRTPSVSAISRTLTLVSTGWRQMAGAGWLSALTQLAHEWLVVPGTQQPRGPARIARRSVAGHGERGAQTRTEEEVGGRRGSSPTRSRGAASVDHQASSLVGTRRATTRSVTCASTLVDVYEGARPECDPTPPYGFQLLWGHRERGALTWLGDVRAVAVDPSLPLWGQPNAND